MLDFGSGGRKKGHLQQMFKSKWWSEGNIRNKKPCFRSGLRTPSHLESFLEVHDDDDQYDDGER